MLANEKEMSKELDEGAAAPEGVTLDPQFKYEVADQPGGEGLLRCFACGTCTASCPIQEINEDYSPRKIIRMILLGMRKEVLTSEFIWHCANCNTCYEHCPQDVRFTEISHVIKKMALKEAEEGNIKLKGSKPAFDRFFVENFMSHGRLYEMGLMSRYFMKNPDLKAILGYIPVGIKMVSTGKLKFLPSNIKNAKDVKKLFLSAMEEGRDISLDLLPSHVRKIDDIKKIAKFFVGEGTNVKDNLIPSNVDNIIELYNMYRKELLQFSMFIMEEDKE